MDCFLLSSPVFPNLQRVFIYCNKDCRFPAFKYGGFHAISLVSRFPPKDFLWLLTTFCIRRCFILFLCLTICHSLKYVSKFPFDLFNLK